MHIRAAKLNNRDYKIIFTKTRWNDSNHSFL